MMIFMIRFLFFIFCIAMAHDGYTGTWEAYEKESW